MFRVDVYVETRAEIEFTPHKCLGQEIKDMLSLPRFDPEGWGATGRWWYAQEKTQPRPSSTVFLQSKSGTTYQKMVPRDLKTLREALIDTLVTTAVAQREICICIPQQVSMC